MAVLPWLEAPLAQCLANPIPSALLVTGPSGIGKSAFAHDLAQALLCEAPQPDASRRALACGQCLACGWFVAGNHPDFRRVAPNAETADTAEAGEESPAATLRTKRVAASKLIRMEQVQQVLEFAAVGGHRGTRRIAVIDPADAMNREAANALLKTLEEPSAGMLFILVTSNGQRLLPTVRSRCRSVVLPAVPETQALHWLTLQPGLSPNLAAELLAAEGGAPLSAANASGALNGGHAAGSAVYRDLIDVIGALPDTGLAGSVDKLADIEPKLLVRFVQQWLVDLACVKAGASPRYFPARLDRMKLLAGRTTLAALARAGQSISRQRALVDHPLNPRLFAEETLRRYSELY